MNDKLLAGLAAGLIVGVSGYLIGKKKTEHDYQVVADYVIGTTKVCMEVFDWIPDGLTTLTQDEFIRQLIEKREFVALSAQLL